MFGKESDAIIKAGNEYGNIVRTVCKYCLWWSGKDDSENDKDDRRQGEDKKQMT